jgi:hypothetical protein
VVSAKQGNFIKSQHLTINKGRETNYNSCTGRSNENIYIAISKSGGAPEKRKRQYETQFITKLGGKSSLGPSYFSS